MNDLKVTIVQSALVWEDIDANLSAYGKMLTRVAPGSTDLIVLPEMFSTGFTMNAKNVAETKDGRAVRWMAKMAAEKNCVITGSLVIKENNHYYNRLVWMNADGNCEFYDKRHLFRMGEEQNTYSPGNKRLIVNLKGWRICALICYDLRFPVWSRNVEMGKKNESSPAYDGLIYVANWPGVRSHAWKQLLVARAIENICYVIGVNRVGADGNNIAYSGDSAVINAKGEIIGNANSNAEYIETVTLSGNELVEFRKNFPAAKDADNFILAP